MGGTNNVQQLPEPNIAYISALGLLLFATESAP